MILSLILGVILGAVSVIFITQNVTIVTVTFLTWQIEGSLALVLLLTLLCGIVITLLLILPSLIKDTFYVSALKKEKKVLEDELTKTKGELAVISSRPPNAVSSEQA
jgi:uncharacterized integral membrane protein